MGLPAHCYGMATEVAKDATEATESGDPGTEEPAFEEALRRLEEIVTALEEGDVPLSDLVDQYAAGDRLLKVCQRRLAEAEMKIEKLRETADGPVAEPFDPDADDDS